MKLEMTSYELECFKKGDRWIYDKFFEKYFREIACFCGKLTNNPQQGEEIASDTLVKLWIRHAKFETEAHIYGFIYLTARNACVNYLKAEKRRKEKLGEMVYFPNEQDEFFTKIDGDLLALFLSEEVAKLPGRVRDVFELLYFDQMTIPEVARKLGISENNVSVHKNKAIALLKAALLKRPDLFMLAILLSLAADNLPN